MNYETIKNDNNDLMAEIKDLIHFTEFDPNELYAIVVDLFEAAEENDYYLLDDHSNHDIALDMIDKTDRFSTGNDGCCIHPNQLMPYIECYRLNKNHKIETNASVIIIKEFKKQIKELKEQQKTKQAIIDLVNSWMLSIELMQDKEFMKSLKEIYQQDAWLTSDDLKLELGIDINE